MDTLILYLAAFLLLIFSLLKSRKKTGLALKKALGVRFALSRLAIDIIGIVIIAFAIKSAVPRKEVERLYAAAALVDERGGKK